MIHYQINKLKLLTLNFMIKLRFQQNTYDIIKKTQAFHLLFYNFCGAGDWVRTSDLRVTKM